MTQFWLTEPLDAVAARALGALVEKAFTTPDNYPLSLNALTAACNQTSNREPVMQLSESDVAAAVRLLEQRSLVREVHRSDSRVKRYRHLLQDTLSLHDPELALLCVLLLRGPQTLGELRGRSTRMTEFIDLAHAEITLQSLVSLSLAVQLPRQPGQKEARYAHLLAGEPEAMPEATSPAAASPPPADLLARVEALEQELAELRERFETFLRQFQ